MSLKKKVLMTILRFFLSALVYFGRAILFMIFGFILGRLYSEFDLTNLPKAIENNFLLNKSSTLENEAAVFIIFVLPFLWAVISTIMDIYYEWTETPKKESLPGVPTQ